MKYLLVGELVYFQTVFKCRVRGVGLCVIVHHHAICGIYRLGITIQKAHQGVARLVDLLLRAVLVLKLTLSLVTVKSFQESHFPDGVILREHADGRREVLSAKDL